MSGPYLVSVSPSGTAVRPDAPLIIKVLDGTSQLDPSSVQLKFNGAVVTPSIARLDNVTTIQYAPAALLGPASLNTVSLSYADTNVPPIASSANLIIVADKYTLISPSFALPPGFVNTDQSGFKVRTVQARSTAGLSTTLARAEAQLAGTLIDPTTRAAYTNLAHVASTPDGYYVENQFINYEQAGNPAGDFPDTVNKIPGIPGLDGQTVNLAMEALTYLALPAGYSQFGVNCTDGFQVRVGNPDARDAFSTVVGQFDGVRSFPADNIFSIVAPTAGIYAFRLIWDHGGGGGNIDFFSLFPDGSTALVNDLSVTNAVKAYQSLSATSRLTPYVQSFSPKIDEYGVGRRPAFNVRLVDGDTQVAPATVVLRLNGQALGASITKTGAVTTVSFQGTNELDLLQNCTVDLAFRDTGNPPTTISDEWHFVTTRPISATGQWDFDRGDLSATVGNNLQYGDGPSGRIVSLTQFGTTTQFGIPDIGGKPAKVMKYNFDPQPLVTQPGYTMVHGVSPNGGGIKANQWTLIMDLFFPSPQENPFDSLIQIGDPTTEGDLFVRWNDVAGAGTGGIGTGGLFTGDGRTNLVIGQWHRIAFALDMAAPTPLISQYIDGVKFQDQGLSAPQLDGTYSLDVSARLFADSENELNTLYVNSIQILDGKLPDDAIADLGGASADGIPIPQTGPPPSLRLTASLGASGVTISWPGTLSGYTLESTTNLLKPTWVAVQGVANNSITFSGGQSKQFFRLRQ